MASSDMASVDPWTWTFRQPSFMDPWFSDAISLETQTLTKALQHSLSNSNSNSNSDSFPYFSSDAPPAVLTPAVSNISGGGSDPETAPKRSIPVSSGSKVSKRKPRKSKRSQTTFINADPANFRQMVQQVTGARLDIGHLQFPQILKPEPQRIAPNAGGGRFAVAAGASLCLPTLDTSAFLLDQNQQASTSSAPASYAAPSGSAADGSGADGVFFDSFASFPTLESWNAM